MAATTLMPLQHCRDQRGRDPIIAEAALASDSQKPRGNLVTSGGCDDRLELDPDRRDALSLAFKKFAEIGSIRQLAPVAKRGVH
jgi:hypothetical protein